MNGPRWWNATLRVLGVVVGVLSVNTSYCAEHPSRCTDVAQIIKAIEGIQL